MSFGFSKKKTSGASSQDVSGTQTTQLDLDDAAIAKLIEDVLGGTNGLASVFGGEQNAGIFDSSVAAQASGDLAANIVGELAKLTGKETITKEGTTTGTSSGSGSGAEAGVDLGSLNLFD